MEKWQGIPSLTLPDTLRDFLRFYWAPSTTGLASLAGFNRPHNKG